MLQSDENMALNDVLTVDDLVEITGQSREQLRKDREAAAKMVRRSEGE